MPKRIDAGFTLIEILIVIGILGVLSGIVMVSIGPALKKSRDTARKATLSQVGRIMVGGSCYVPTAGVGDYDIGDIFDEIISVYPKISKVVSAPPRDPRGGTENQTLYRYVVDSEGNCAIYANLERGSDQVTLESITEVTPGAGSGVLNAGSPGVHGTTRYYQVSN